MMWLSRGQMSFGGFAVAIFFFASGFYVTKSLLAKKTGKQYFKARIERLYPAFFVALLLTAFVLGPLVRMQRGHLLYLFTNLHLFSVFADDSEIYAAGRICP